MQKQYPVQRSSGAKAVAIDTRIARARYRLWLFLSLLFSAAFAMGLHIVFGR
jgi:hypothetical protein